MRIKIVIMAAAFLLAAFSQCGGLVGCDEDDAGGCPVTVVATIPCTPVR